MKRETDVLVVGGGGAGLTTSMLLSGLGVDHLLVSALPTTSDLPKAHVLNQRAMEILEDAGVAGVIDEASTPSANMSHTAFYSGFTGSSPSHGRRVLKLECWGAGGDDEAWKAASPWRQRNLPQIRLEPLLKQHAEALAPGSVRFGHELVDLSQDADGVTARVRIRDTDEEYVVRAKFLVGADGGRTVPGLIGVEHLGLGVLTQTATMHVTADLSGLAPDDDVLIRWILSPQSGVYVVMVPMGPDHWGTASEEWVIHINYPVDDPRALSDFEVESDVRRSLGIGDLPMKIHKTTRWSVDAVMAERFRVGRVFLLGDAAHRHPPTGGLGLTSAIHDAHNLSWKLAAVLGGQAGTALLDTYEAERRPSLEWNAQRSLENAMNHFSLGPTLGISHENTEEQNLALLDRLFSTDPADVEFRSTALRIMRSQSMEFSELNVEYGYRYESQAIVPDGTEPAPSFDDVRIYTPSTRPGSPLPHAWIDDDCGARRPIKDLVRPGRFLLIAGEEGQPWCDAARALAQTTGIPIDALRIGHIDGDLFDPRLMWLRSREIGPDGAVLVRPDRFVAWRNVGGSAEPMEELESALSSVLARPSSTSAPFTPPPANSSAS